MWILKDAIRGKFCQVTVRWCEGPKIVSIPSVILVPKWSANFMVDVYGTLIDSYRKPVQTISMAAKFIGKSFRWGQQQSSFSLPTSCGHNGSHRVHVRNTFRSYSTNCKCSCFQTSVRTLRTRVLDCYVLRTLVRTDTHKKNTLIFVFGMWQENNHHYV